LPDCKLHNTYGSLILPEEAYFGVEYEIESVLVNQCPPNKFGFVSEEDNSLRNGGREFKTGPLTFEKSIEAFKWLHSTIKYVSGAFSERTSIHVHVNVGNFSPQEAKFLVLTYALLEPFFFSFVGEKRKSSIYCVPLNYTTLPSIYCKAFSEIADSWHKYTAFNILPVKSFGTVEFRHLEGTNDLNRFTTWLTAIKALHDLIYVEKFNPLEILNNKDDIITLAKTTLPEFTKPFTDLQIKEMMYDSILDVKLASGGITS